MPGREHPPELVALASRALEPDPERRMRSATEFLQALEEYMIGADKQRESTALATRARDSLSSQHAGYETFAEAINMLERAMVLWPDNREAEQARTAAIERYTRLALANRDLKLARLLAQRMPDSQVRSLLLAQVHELEELEKQRDAELAAAHENVIFFADSRANAGDFRNVIIKPNAREAAGIMGKPEPSGGHDTRAALEGVGRELARRNGRPVYITLGPDGMLVCRDEGATHVPGIPVTGPLDICGAGDSATAGIVSALCAGATETEAALMGNLVASITVQQVGTTGTATPTEVLQRFIDTYAS